MRVIFLGAPGTGKGTQAVWLSDKFTIPQISTGDILRKAVADGTELGKKADVVMKSGGLVSDDLIIALVRERLDQPDCRPGFILDGFPRTIAQGESLDLMLGRDGAIQSVIFFEVSEAEIVRRLTSRRTCSGCARNYNMISDPPPASGLCGSCGGRIIQRPDDSEETVRKRLQVYDEKTAPLKEFYNKQKKLYILRAEQPVERVREELAALLSGL
ncbi:MAG TPA: adenylate kinase [bacterium]|nr:adenylate kinase [bacterium]HOC26001.1 adenylate kinase [bacterium]HOH08933.1 adenylate kinase [bacterium]HOY44862.1 adenylate kinase [bacterium]HPG83348.1 adenylate kinase [bacterium]